MRQTPKNLLKDLKWLPLRGRNGVSNRFFVLSPAELLCSKMYVRTSLVAQLIRIRLPMQRTQVRSLVQEDPACNRATKFLSYNYCACALEPLSRSYWVHEPQLLKPACLGPVLHSKRNHHNEKPVHHIKLAPAHCNQRKPAQSNRDPARPNIKK